MSLSRFTIERVLSPLVSLEKEQQTQIDSFFNYEMTVILSSNLKGRVWGIFDDFINTTSGRPPITSETSPYDFETYLNCKYFPNNFAKNYLPTIKKGMTVKEIISAKFKVNWQPWARLQSGTAAAFIFTGAVIAIFYSNKILMALSFFFSTLILALEYPLVIVPLLSTNFYVRGIFYLLVAAQGMILAPTHTGSLCLICAGITYIIAASNGENGIPKANDKKGRK